MDIQLSGKIRKYLGYSQDKFFIQQSYNPLPPPTLRFSLYYSDCTIVSGVVDFFIMVDYCQYLIFVQLFECSICCSQHIF